MRGRRKNASLDESFFYTPNIVTQSGIHIHHDAKVALAIRIKVCTHLVKGLSISLVPAVHESQSVLQCAYLLFGFPYSCVQLVARSLKFFFFLRSL